MQRADKLDCLQALGIVINHELRTWADEACDEPGAD